MEKYIIGANCSGKTRKMLETAKEDNAIVVCKNSYAMANKANSYGIYGLKFISYEDFLINPIYGQKLAIDEIGNFFKGCFAAELDAFTMTVD